MTGSGRYALVTLASLDLRRRPEHRSELGSQLLLGEAVRILGSAAAGRWRRVENLADGYRGWARAWGLRECRAAEARAWVKKARGFVAARVAELRERPGSGRLVSPLFWNSRVLARTEKGGWIQIGLPDGRVGWTPRRAIRPGGRGARRLEAILDDLYGTPYLWGGRTPMGFDCSGLTQQVFLELGIRLPRDAEQQHRLCVPLDRGQTPRRGDLAFFGPPRGRVGHVGILLGGGLYAHARGWVRLGSLDPGNPLCENALLETLRGFGRPPRGSAGKGRLG